MILIRFVIGVLVAVIVAVALIPLYVLQDLRSGGSGWGLCAEGLGRCRTSYFAGFELVAILLVAMLLIVLTIGGLVRLLRYLQRRLSSPVAG